ncbi:MAG: FtsW/RodA/SpoVE family cell cycle protein [Elusimicrobiota bacterium]
MITVERKKKFDWVLLIFVGILIIIGSIAITSSTIMLYSKERIIKTHFLAIFLGFLGMLLMWVLDYDILDEYSYKIYIFALITLVLVLIFGVVDKGSRSWFRLPFFSIQPSEFARISLIVVLSSYLSKNRDALENLGGIIKALFISLPFFVLMMKQPDFSGVMITIFPIAVMFIVAGVNLSYIYAFGTYILIMLLVPFIGVIVNLYPNSLNNQFIEFLYDISYFNFNSLIFIIILAVLMFILWKIFHKLNPLIHFSYMVMIFLIVVSGYLSGIFVKNQIKDYQYKRIESFIHPDKDPKGSGYNIIQARVALGSGGFKGKGIFHGSQSRLGFVPERHTDFIVSVIGEEMGFIGVIVIFASYIVFINRIRKIALISRNNFGYFLCCGFAGLFMGYFFVNLGMILGFFPVAGIPLAMVSYGGSNMVASLVIIGIVESIYARRMAIG